MKTSLIFISTLCIFMCACNPSGTSSSSVEELDTCCVVEEVALLDTATVKDNKELVDDSVVLHVESPDIPSVTIGRDYYNFTIGKTSKTKALDRVRNNGFHILSGTQDGGIDVYSCLKKFTWNNISWNEVDLYFKNDTLVGISFAKACNSEVQAKHYLERVTYIYWDDYKSIMTEKSSDFIFFDDHKTAMEIYGGDLLMYLRISESSIAEKLI